jgi:IS30 family transposase
MSVDQNTKTLPVKLMPDKPAGRASKSMPTQLRNTLTPDNGKELAARKSPSQTFAPGIRFARPHPLMGAAA